MYNPIETASNKVFIVVNSFGRGGAEMSLAMLAFELFNKGYSVYYISLWDEYDKYDFKWLELKGVNVVTLSPSKKSTFRYMYKLFILVKTHRPQFIYSAMLKADLLSRIVAAIFKIKSASSIRNNPVKYYRSQKLKLLLFLVIQKFQKNIVFISNRAKSEFLSAYSSKFSKSKIFTLHNPIAFENVITNQFLEKKLNSFVLKCNDYKVNKQTNFKLAIVSRLVIGKGLLEFLNNIKMELSESFFVLEIFGDGPLKEEISDFIITNNLKNKIFLKGFVSNKIDIFSNIDILFFPSESEGFGRVPFEAILMGNIVVCNKEVSIIDEFFQMPLLWNSFEYPFSISDMILDLADLDVEDSIRKINKLSTKLSPITHCDNFLQIMNDCV
jgi:hypothetical protein